MASEENDTVEDRTEPNKQDERAQVILTCDEKGFPPDPLEDIQSSEVITSNFECPSGVDNPSDVGQGDEENILSVSITSTTTATTCEIPPSSSAPESSESKTIRSAPSFADVNALLSTETMEESDEASDTPMEEQPPFTIYFSCRMVSKNRPKIRATEGLFWCF